jgi:DNA-binding SARP family transcriptional activator/predicted ATPase
MLEISLLGEIVIRMDGEPVTRFRSQKEIALLAYLAHSGHAHNREALADLLWEARSTKQSLSNLRTALARLRKQVGEYIVVTRKTVAVIPAVHEQTDSARFQTMLAGAGKERPPTGSNLLAQGLELYSGEFMAGFSLAQTPRFNDWLVVEQEHLRQIAMRGYRQLAGWQEEQGVFSAGVSTVQQWVTWDPWDETAQQQLMRLLVKDGRVAEALAAYEKYRLLLQSDLGIPPAPATTALHDAIQDGSLAPPEIAPAPLHNLPRALTLLYGRKNEIRKLIRTLLNPEYPLISITGAGGMGKTSLALATGRQLLLEDAHPFRDGIWFITLEDIENENLEVVREEVATLVGQAMGLYFHSARDLWSQLLGQLTSKYLLLILDNIEQILTIASDLIVDLLAAGEDIHLLVSSRSTLSLAASVAFPLTGLETPAQLSAEALNNESVRLFAERAARMPVPFHLENHLAEVVAICQFVEGMPLGIELASASLGNLMVDEIMPALTGNLHLLDSRGRDLPPRQRTLHAVFETSWQLLNPRERNMLSQISIFRGGFTRQAAEAVTIETASGLYNLQNHALLRRDDTGRFRFHPLLRQLAREKLNSPNTIDIEQQALIRHTIYFADFMQSFTDDLQRGLGQEALQTILPEQANLRAAWQHAVQEGQWQAIAACLDSTHFFYQRRGLFSEEETLVDNAITCLQATMEEDDGFSTGLLSRLLTVRARGYLHSAQFENGLKAAKRAVDLAIKLQNPGLEGQARLAWARILSTQHKREPALVQFEQTVDLAKTAQNSILEADGWIGVGEQKLWIRDLKSTQESLHTALDLCQNLQYTAGEVQTLILLGDLTMRQGAFELSVDYNRQTLQLSRLMGDVSVEAKALGSLGVGLTALGDSAGSQNSHEEALAIFRRLNMPESEQWILGQLGYTAIQLGDYTKAEQLLTEALAIATKLKDLFWQAWLKLRLGWLCNERWEPDKALPYIKEAYQTAEQFQYDNFKSAVEYDWGNILLNQGEWANAAVQFQKAYEYRQGSGRIENATPSLAGLAYATYQQGMTETAAAHAEQLWQTWQGSPEMADRADLKLYWRLGMVWDGLGDCRANDLWNQAHALLHERCEKIPDERARKMFLEQVPAHRAILKVPI